MNRMQHCDCGGKLIRFYDEYEMEPFYHCGKCRKSFARTGEQTSWLTSRPLEPEADYEEIMYYADRNAD